MSEHWPVACNCGLLFVSEQEWTFHVRDEATRDVNGDGMTDAEAAADDATWD